MLVKALRDRRVDRIHFQCQVRRKHTRGVPLRWIMGIRNCACSRSVLRSPLMRACWAFREFPVVLEQSFEVVVVPLRWRVGPCAFKAAGDSVATVPSFEVALPAEALLDDVGTFGFRTDMLGRRRSSVSLTESVSACDERNRLFVIHCHAGKGLADIPRRRDRIGLSIGTFRINVNQTHLDRAERSGEITIAAVTLISQPRALGSPVGLVGFPYIGTPAAKAEGLESHRFQRDVAGEDHEVCPGNLPAILLLYRPQQPTRLVEVRIVGPAIERRKALKAGPGSATAIANPISPGAMPRHTNEKRPIMTVIRRPPLLRVGH